MVRNRVDEMQYTTPVFLPPWVVHRQRHSTESIAATESVPIAATEPIAQPSPESEEEWSDANLALWLANRYAQEREDDAESPTGNVGVADGKVADDNVTDSIADGYVADSIADGNVADADDNVTDSINELPSSTRRPTATSPIAKLEEPTRRPTATSPTATSPIAKLDEEADDEGRASDVGCYVEEALRFESQLVESPPQSPSGSSTLGSSEDEGNAAPPVDPDDEPLPPLPEATTHRHPKQERSNLLI